MKLITLIIEFAIIATVFLLIGLVAYWLTGMHNNKMPHFDISLHDTYLVLHWQTIIILPFLIAITLFYLVKEGFYKYKRRFQNLILITGNFTFIILLTRFLSFISVFKGSWQIEPQLSALPKAHIKNQYVTVIDNIEQATFILLITFLLILAISTIFIGKNWKANTGKANI